MKSPCKHPGCPSLVQGKGWCDRHKRDATRHKRAYDERRKDDPALALAAKIRSSRRWKSVRLMALRRNPLCSDPFGDHAKHRLTVEATQVHHIEGLAVAPKKAFNLDNLAPVCTRCHARIERAERQ